MGLVKQTNAGAVSPAGPAADADRRRMLVELGILDSPPEPEFDDLTVLAARLCDTPIALVSLVDDDRLWFKSRWGMTDTEVRKHTSFCRHTLQSSAVLVVPDARLDERFRDSPLVTSEGGFRFYAGAPLVLADGVGIGALCVLDSVPREFGPQQVQDLTMIARQVVSQLELRLTGHRLRREIVATTLAEAELRRSRQLLDEVLAHTDVLVYVKDPTGRFLMANKAMERAVGATSGSVVGRTGAEVFAPGTAAEFGADDDITLRSGASQVFAEELVRADGTIGKFRSTKFPLTDASGSVYAIAGVSTDVTEVTAVRAGMLESERRFRALFDYSPVSLALSDEQGRWIEVNAACGALLGASPAELIGRSALEFTHPDDHVQIARAELEQFQNARGVGEAEVRMSGPDGPQRWAWLNLTPIPGPDGRQWTLGVAQDITARKTAENNLRRSEEELAAVAAVARCVQSGTDPRPVVVDCVRSLSGADAVRLLEIAAAAVLVETARSDGDSAGPLADGSAESVCRTGRPLLRAGCRPGVAATLWQPVVVGDDVIAVLEVDWSRPVPELSDRAVAAVQVLADETGASLHAAQLRSELERSAATDPLTGALNRRAWTAQLESLMEQARGAGESLTIALVDLDNFKSYNDSHGHVAGDELLRDFATDVREQIGGRGLFARWGGEEFILALSDTDAEPAADLLARIGRAVPGTQTCSIGHTGWQPGDSVATCIKRADLALYEAKASGRDRVVAG